MTCSCDSTQAEAAEDARGAVAQEPGAQGLLDEILAGAAAAGGAERGLGADDDEPVGGSGAWEGDESTRLLLERVGDPATRELLEGVLGQLGQLRRSWRAERVARQSAERRSASLAERLARLEERGAGAEA
jgi:hypothetical protein